MRKSRAIVEKKVNGVFYSSEVIARFICEKVINDWFSAHHTLSDLQQIKILDNACGEGVFLVEAFFVLKNIYVTHFPTVPNVELHILENNLYGVDIEGNSVNATQKNLLKAANFGAFCRLNIKQGNSLISDKTVAENAFDWAQEFPFSFDIVVGNPPWGATLREKEYLKQKFPLSSFGEINSYKYFIDLSLQLLKNEGHLGLIVPDSYLEKDYFSDIRKLISSKCFEIWNIKLGDKIFEEVNMPSAILYAKIGIKDNQKFYFTDITNLSLLERINLLKEQLQGVVFNTEIPTIEKSFIIRNILYRKENYLPLSTVYEQVMGVKIYQIGKGKPKQTGEEWEKDLFISDKKLNNLYYPFVAQGIYRYYYEDKKEFIKYGEWLAEPREWHFFAAPKIVVREIMNNYLYATYLPNVSVIKNIAGVIIQKNEQYSLEYLLSLLCSRLFAYCIRQESPKSGNQAFPSITSNILKNLPIKELSLQKQQPFIDAAREMLSLQAQFYEGKNQFLELLAINFELPKVSKKLENWQELDKKRFLQELEKQKMHIALKKQSEFFAFFEEEKAKIHDLQQKISTLDRKIDAMVYELYGLNGLEIRQVEKEYEKK